jgi:hypothetical protein
MKKLLPVIASMMLTTAAAAQCNQLFFSEYLEGSSNNKAVEVYNPTGGTVNLTDYKIYRYNNGSPTPTDSLFPQGILTAGDVFVAGNPSAIASILAASDTLHTITFFNGDDCLALIYIPTNTMLDVIGLIGNDPGVNWPVGTGATSEFTLVRMIGVQQGTTSWVQASAEYDVYPQNTDTSLGHHYMTSCCLAATASLVSVSNNPCFGDSAGSIIVGVTGDGPFTYQWLNSTETDSMITGLTDGTYTVVVTGTCGNPDTLSATVAGPAAPITQTLTAWNEPSCTINDGSLTVTASGGTPGYSYAWSNGGSTASISNLAAGSYSLTVTDANGCTHTGSYVLSNPASPVVTLMLTSPYDSVCIGTGEYLLTGGSPAGGTWSGAAVADSMFDSNTTAGWSMVMYTYTDSLGCTGSAMDSIYVDLCLEVGAIQEADFSVAPNPFGDQFILQFADAGEKVISIYSVQGALVYTANVTGPSTRIASDALPAGTYLLQVSTGSAIITQLIQKAE